MNSEGLLGGGIFRTWQNPMYQPYLADSARIMRRFGKRVQWHGQQQRDWLDWIGDPVPGAEHKWATRVEYRALREGPDSVSED